MNVELKQKAGCLKEKIKTRTPPSELGICHIKLILCDTSSVLHFYNGYSNINDIKEVKCDEFKCLRQNTTRTKQTEIRDAGFGGKWRGCFILLLLNSTFSKVQKFHLVWAYERTTDMFKQHTNRGYTAEMVELVQQPPAPPVPTVKPGNCGIKTHL